MTNGSAESAFSVQRLLETSEPRRSVGLGAPLFLGGIIIATLLTIQGKGAWVQAVLPGVLAGLIIFSVLHSMRVAKVVRREQEGLRLSDEAIRLGRWDEAEARLVGMLSAPFQRVQTRYQALLFLSSLLARLGRHEDSLKLHDYLLATAQMPQPISFSLRCARAYALLREERLTDAYEAIGQLRREDGNSAMLNLLEMYRLVKMGHREDAMQLFEQKRMQMTRQIGHRMGDAWALVGVAARNSGKMEDAARCRRNALLLGNADEIARRFPECAALLKGAGEI
jgi:hypothetical protein